MTAAVDVLIPYWGEFKLLREAVDSVLAQTRTDFRLLIIDDHYHDGAARDYYSRHEDQRISYLRHAKNIGITNNFNFALAQARADFCVLMGCDDKMKPDYLERALQKIAGADFYQPGVEVIDEQGKSYLPLGDKVKRWLRPKKIGIYSGEKLAASLCVGNWLYFPALMWRTKIIKKYGFNTRYKIVEDVELELAIIKNGGKLYLDPAVTFQYRRFPQSLSSREKAKNGVRFAEEREVYDKWALEFAKMGWGKAARAASWRVTSRINNMLAR
jgi:glycosyltransferase involved in cell wall biosynthesis